MFEHTTLQIFTYLVFFASIVAYAALDGFDLGVGALHLLVKKDKERRIFLNSIGPVWDGNSVWIVIAIGVLFAGFPFAFAKLFSSLYLPMMFLIVGLMFRTVAMEFRSKSPLTKWRTFWDITFALSSYLLMINLGMIIGALITGLPIDENGKFLRDQFQFITIYSVSISLLVTSLFALHGAIYLAMKTDGELRDRVKSWVPTLSTIFVFFWFTATLLTVIREPYMFDRFKEHPVLFFIALLAVGCILSISYFERVGRYGLAFVASTGSIALLVTLVGIGIFPHIVTSSIDYRNSLTLYNASSGLITLRVIMVVVLIGLPLSFGYLFFLYRTFRGKVEIDEKTSY
ncbi:MAG: cytochrome d ubiquinol oxidase subunit II [Waddliaceae bacterium]